MEYLRGYASEGEEEVVVSLPFPPRGQKRADRSEDVVCESGTAPTDSKEPARKAARKVTSKPKGFVPPQVANRRPNGVTEDMSAVTTTTSTKT